MIDWACYFLCGRHVIATVSGGAKPFTSNLGCGKEGKMRQLGFYNPLQGHVSVAVRYVPEKMPATV